MRPLRACPVDQSLLLLFLFIIFPLLLSFPRPLLFLPLLRPFLLLLLFLLGARGKSGAMGKRLDVRPALSDAFQCEYFGPLISFLGDGAGKVAGAVLCRWV